MHIFCYLHIRALMVFLYLVSCRILFTSLVCHCRIGICLTELSTMLIFSSYQYSYLCLCKLIMQYLQLFNIYILPNIVILEYLNNYLTKTNIAMDPSSQTYNRPIPLIQFHGDQFKITQQAIDFLRKLQGPMGVITIVGKYRTGKSLFLNKVLLNNNDSFKVCPTINSCTKGLWISRQIIKSQHPQAQDMDVIVIDSQGFGAMEETDAYNNKILLFALLLSSYFIYNSVGSIDEKSLNNLNVITNLAKELQAKNVSNQKIQEEFPTFMWLVRDFTLKLVDSNGCPMEPKQYLEYALEIQKGLSDAVENKNKIRRMIKHFFRQRDCFTLVTPVENQNDLQKLNSLPDNALRPEFLEQIQTLRQKILKRVKPKKLKHRKLTGQTLIQLATTYIQAINNGSLPNIQSAWKSIYNFQLNQTISKAKQLVYKKSVQFLQHIQTDQTFAQLQKQLKNQTHAFMKKKISNQSDLQSHYQTIKQFIQSTIITLKSKNKKKSLQILLNDFNQKCEQIGYQLPAEDLDKKWNKLEKIYREQYKQNPSLSQFLLQHLYPLKFQAYSSLLRRQSDVIKSQQSEKKVIRQTLQNKLRLSQQNGKQLQNNLYQSDRQLTLLRAKCQEQTKIKNLQFNYIHKQINQLKQDLQKSENKVEFLSKQIKQKDNQISDLRIKANSLGSELKQSDDDRSYAKKQLQILRNNLTFKIKEIQDLKQMNQELKAQVQKLQDRQANYANRTRLQMQSKSIQFQNLLTKYEHSQKQLNSCQQKITKLESCLDSQSIRISKEQRLYQTMLQTLKQNFQSERKHTFQLTQANKNMAFALKHLQQRFEQAEQKQKKLKEFKRCFKNSSCMQCQNCTKFFVPTIFPQHLNVCILGPESLKKIENEKQKSFTPLVEISVKQTLLKDSDSKPYTQYVLDIKKGSKTWCVNRKYKQFCDLHSQLKTLLPGIHLSDFSYIVNPQQGTKKSLLVQQRKKILQKYLYDLSSNPHIAQENIWRGFIQDNEQIIQNTFQSPNHKLAITQLLRSTQNIHHDLNSPQKENNFDSNRQNHKTPQEFLRIWNQRNLRAKQVSKSKKMKC